MSVFLRILIANLVFGIGHTALAKAGPRPDANAEKPDVHAIVKQAVANFTARESLPKDYTYLETIKADDAKLRKGRSTDVYEIIEVKGHAFRRHLEHDGQKLAREERQDEEYRAKLLEAEHKILEEQIRPGHTRESLEAAVHKIMEDSGLKDWQPQLTLPPDLPSMGVVQFTETLYKFKLPIEDLDQKFELKLKEQKALNGRATYLVQANPKHFEEKSERPANFRIKVWIDQQEMEIVKVEGEALSMGLLAAPEYSSFSAKGMPEKEVAERKQQLAGSRLYYSDRTKIMQEWSKVNDEAWLLHRRHVKGSHIFFLGDQWRAAFSNDVEYDFEDTNYKKFRVQHRFLSGMFRQTTALEQ